MGFPVGYSEVPKIFLHAIFLIANLRRLLSVSLEAAGLGPLLCPASAVEPPPPQPEAADTVARRYESFQQAASASAASLAMQVICELVPAVRFGDLDGGGGGYASAGGCAVCLLDFGGDELVRRLGSCRHVFHRGCVDRWVEHGQRTCPLCRAPLIDWAAAAVVAEDVYDDY